mmetsp:Transcript_74394/g.198795  ORF Transcript_74394/g.198795 Transcript_74394/m.198795 type:complete len:597 (-) Transcript_74394:1452-3242(-)
MPEEMDAEDGEVREVPNQDPRREEKRKGATDDAGSKRLKSDRDRSRSRERGNHDRDRERDKRVSYDQVQYSGDPYERYDRYGPNSFDPRDGRGRNDRGRDSRDYERDERSRRADYEKEMESRERDKRREIDRDRRRDDRDDRRNEKDVERKRDDKDGDRRKDDKDADRRKEKEKGKEHRSGKDDKDKRDDKDRRRSRSRSKDRKGKDDRHDDRDKKKDKHSHKEKDESKGSKDKSGDKDDVFMVPEDEEEAIRKRRQAILEKYKSKTGLNGSTPSAPTSQAQTPAAPEDMFEEKDESKTDEKTVATAVNEALDLEDKDQVDTDHVFAAKEKRGSDDEGDDMFTTSPMRARAAPKARADGDVDDERRGEEVDRSGVEEVDRRMGDTNADNWDDAEGYFRTRTGELLIGRYLVNRDIGNGVYSSVVSAIDQTTGNEVAIKIVRSNETMTQSGRKEIEVLKKLGAEDPEGKRHICKLLSHFDYKNHLCMVFVPLEMNLRKLLKTYGREVGITLSAIKQYTRQLLIGLAHMMKNKVVHGDIKLDNIVITKDLKNVAICDFGTADWENEAVITPYMVSRYYRPPEICLGLRTVIVSSSIWS